MKILKFRTLVLMGGLFLSLSITARADGLTFSNLVALQNNGNSKVDLFSNPNSSLVGSQLTFLIDLTGTLPVSGSDTLVLTFMETGQAPVIQEFQIPLFPGVPLPYTQLFSFTPHNPTPQGTAITLTVNILGNTQDFVIPSGPHQGEVVDSYSNTFNVVTPVPEPATLGFFLAGVSAIVARRRKGRSR